MVETTLIHRQRKYSAEERAALLEKYKRRENSQKLWCEENGIALGTLHKWLERDNRELDLQVKQSWTPVVAIAQDNGNQLLLQVGKCSITVHSGTDMELLSAVLRVVTAQC